MRPEKNIHFRIAFNSNINIKNMIYLSGFVFLLSILLSIECPVKFDKIFKKENIKTTGKVEELISTNCCHVGNEYFRSLLNYFPFIKKIVKGKNRFINLVIADNQRWNESYNIRAGST
jgi:hypothetical protein